jgi:hypothetical protein
MVIRIKRRVAGQKGGKAKARRATEGAAQPKPGPSNTVAGYELTLNDAVAELFFQLSMNGKPVTIEELDRLIQVLVRRRDFMAASK